MENNLKKSPVHCLCGGSLQRLTRPGAEWTNLYCSKCKGHWSGNINEEKWYTRQEWDQYVNN